MEPDNLVSAFQKEAQSKADDIAEGKDIDWEDLNYQQIEYRLNNWPVQRLIAFCEKQPDRCRETLHNRQIKEFGDDKVEDGYVNPARNYMAAQVRYYLDKDENDKANQISSQLLEYLRTGPNQPKEVQVYSPNLGFNWFPKGKELRDFKINPCEESELRSKLVTLGVDIDDWVRIFDLDGGRAYYFMSEFELDNFAPFKKNPPTFVYFLKKMGLTEKTYKQWK